jgi:enoyl-CoA hydratase/carnithine racemase
MTTAAPTGTITVSIADGVVSVEIDNPSQKNALTRSMCLELQHVMPRLDADPSVVAITLSGAGGTFSAGAPINDLASVLLDPQPDGSRVDQLSRADDAISAVAKPTVALVDGACMGGGWQIASACDFIVASARSVFAITPAKLGVIYPRAGIERLVRQVGLDRAKFILFTGQKFSATRAQELGLVAETVADSEFTDRCRSLVASLMKRSQFSIHTIKHLIDLPDSDSVDIDQEWADAWAAMSDGPDLAIGVAAFLEREQPLFTWAPNQASTSSPQVDG